MLISATGTGKTYASAFAMRELGFKRVLFLVHRNQLARQTKKSYEKVFPKAVSMGIISGGDSIDNNIDKRHTDLRCISIICMIQFIIWIQSFLSFPGEAFSSFC